MQEVAAPALSGIALLPCSGCLLPRVALVEAGVVDTALATALGAPALIITEVDRLAAPPKTQHISGAVAAQHLDISALSRSNTLAGSEPPASFAY